MASSVTYCTACEKWSPSDDWEEHDVRDESGEIVESYAKCPACEHHFPPLDPKTIDVDSVMKKINAHVQAAEDESAAIAFLGGDIGITDEERAEWRAAPTLEEIERDIRALAG